MSESQYQKKIFKGDISVGELRYSEVLKLIEQKQIRKMIDFGCSQCHLLKRVQNFQTIKHMIGIDIDDKMFPIEDLKPFNINRLERNIDQVVELYQGSVLQQYKQLKDFNTDFVSLVEVIQHIDEKGHEKLNENVFSYLRPKYVFISTPNVQFNVAFSWGSVKRFRHYDHRFEWTRKQFQDYVNKVCKKYGYKASISGVGQALQHGLEQNGYCSQIVIFQRLQNKLDLSQSKKHKNKFQNLNESVSTLCSPLQQNIYLPLTLKYTHTNYSWRSIYTQILEQEIELIINVCKPTKILPWHKILTELKTTSIVKKLIKQVSDVWTYDYMLKDTIIGYLKGKQHVVKVMNQGIIKVRQYEKSENIKLREQQELIDQFKNGAFQIEDHGEYFMSISEKQSQFSSFKQENFQNQRNEMPFYNSNKQLFDLRKRKTIRKKSRCKSVQENKSSDSWSVASPPLIDSESVDRQSSNQQSIINY